MANVSIAFLEDFDTEFEYGFGTVIVERHVREDVSTSEELKWDEAVGEDDDGYIPSPHLDPYGFTQAVLEAVGLEVDVQVSFVE